MSSDTPSSLESAAHSAGRPWSRTASKAIYNPEAFRTRMKDLGITHYGVPPDEVWTAYKPIEFVMNVQCDMVKVVVMGGYVRSDDGD